MQTVKLMATAGVVSLLAVFGAAAPGQADESTCVTATDTVAARVAAAFIPQHLAGDKDFSGNGPSVTVGASLSPAVETSPTQGRRGKLQAQYFMDAVELGGDGTRASGRSQAEVVYTAPWGWEIRRIDVEPSDSNRYVDTDQTDDSLAAGSPRSFVSGYRVTGDTPGDEAGTESKVIVGSKAFQVTRVKCS